MTSRIETTLRAAIVAAFSLPVIASFMRAVEAPSEHAANPARPSGLDHDDPVLSWEGRGYRSTQRCDDGRAR